MICDLNSIPDDMVEAAAEALAERFHDEVAFQPPRMDGFDHSGHTEDYYRKIAALVLAAVWPAVEAHWRNTIADEIGLARDAYSPEWDVDASTVAIRRGGYTDAAAVARGKGDQ